MADSKPVFIDTSGWIALLNADDMFHSQAVEIMREFAGTRRVLVTTDWIFALTGNGLARTKVRTGFARTVEAFLVSPHAQLVRVELELFRNSLVLYQQANDKSWGLVDCASFVVMREAGIDEAMTSDHHYEQAGFRCLLPTS